MQLPDEWGILNDSKSVFATTCQLKPRCLPLEPMSFQQHREKTRDWREWVRRNHNRLVDCGIPHDVVADELRWFVFIDHCYDQWSGWSIDQLSAEQARNLFDFLIDEYGEGYDPENSSLVNLLDCLERAFSGHSSRNYELHQRVGRRWAEEHDDGGPT